MSHTILLIDYDPRSVARTSGVLEAAGYRVETASDGQAGSESFHALDPDLVLLEAMLPKRNGFELCKDLKATPAGRETPVVILTAVYTNRRYVNQGFHLYHCDGYLTKPISDEALVTAVREQLDGRAPKARSMPAAAAADGTHGRAPSRARPQSAPEPPAPTTPAPSPAPDDEVVDDLDRHLDVLNLGDA